MNGEVHQLLSRQPIHSRMRVQQSSHHLNRAGGEGGINKVWLTNLSQLIIHAPLVVPVVLLADVIGDGLAATVVEWVVMVAVLAVELEEVGGAGADPIHL